MNTHQHSLDPLAIGAAAGLVIGVAQTRDEIAALRRQLAVRDAWAADPTLADRWAAWDRGEEKLRRRAPDLVTYPRIAMRAAGCALIAPLVAGLWALITDVGTAGFLFATIAIPATYLWIALDGTKKARSQLTSAEVAHLHCHGGHTHTHPHTSRHHHADRTAAPFQHFSQN